MLRIGGENISPFEVEDFLRRHPKVNQVAVIGVPDRRLREVVMVFIQLKEDVDCSEREIIEYCRGKIANFKIPKYVKFVKNFARTGSGKIQKFKLEEIATKELDLD